MTASTVLPILLYILGAVLLVALIVLTIKVIITMNKIEKVVDNITVKVKTLDGAFEVVEKVTGNFNLITDRIIDIIASFIEKIFKRKEDKNNE